MPASTHRNAAAVLAAAAVLVVAAAALAFDLLRTAEERAQQEETRRHQLMARRVAHEVEDHVAFRLQALAAAPLQMPGLAAELMRSERDRHPGSQPVHRAACVWSLDGTLLEADPPSGCPRFLDAAARGGTPTGRLRHRMAAGGGELLLMLERRPAGGGEANAAARGPLLLGLSLDIESMLRTELQAWQMDRTKGDLWVVDGSGALIYHSTHPEMVGRRPGAANTAACASCHPSLMEIQALLTMGEGSGSYAGPNGRALASLAPAHLDGATWTVVVDTPLDDSVRIVRTNARRIMLALALLVAGFVASGGVAVHASWLRGRAQQEARDMTEKQRAEEAQRHSEQQYRAVFEHSRDPIFIAAPSGLLFDINEAGAALLGFTSPDALRGRVKVPDLYADSREARRQGRALVREGWFQDEEVELQRPDGRRVVAMLTAWLAHDASGQPAYQGILRDVTERRLAEREQRRLQRDMERVAAEWRRTVDALDAAVVVVDADGRISRMNRAACTLASWGHPGPPRDFSQSLGLRLSELPELEPWLSLRPLEEVARRGGGSAARRIADAVSGRTWDAQAVAMADERGGTVLLVGDVTRAVEMEEAARRGATLATMGALVAGVAHEVRNPLFGISANVDALEAILGDQPELAEPLAALRRGLGRLTTLMEELLLYGRPAPERLTPFALAEALSVAAADVRELAARGTVAVDLALPPEDCCVQGDRPRLEQAFRNLLENAVQHSPAGTTIAVSTETFSRNGRGWVRCSVSDAGPGFREEDLPRVFEPFFTRRRGGTGLGLAIVQRVVAEHEGRLLAANRPHGGACVTVELPLVEPAC